MSLLKVRTKKNTSNTIRFSIIEKGLKGFEIKEKEDGWG
jgi:hypothetical protein